MSGPDRIAAIREYIQASRQVPPVDWRLIDIMNLVEKDIPWLLERIAVLERELKDAKALSAEWKNACMAANQYANLNLAPKLEAAESALRALQQQIQPLRKALTDLLNVIAMDDLIPESVSYMKQARAALLPSLAPAPDLSKESTVRLVEVLCNLLEQLTHDVGQISDGLLELKATIVPSLAPSQDRT